MYKHGLRIIPIRVSFPRSTRVLVWQPKNQPSKVEFAMEYCAVQGLFHQMLDLNKQRFDIFQDAARRFTIAAIHDIHVGYHQKEPTTVHELLDVRVRNLIPYVRQGFEDLESPSAMDIKRALESAFQRVDKEVQARAEELNFKTKQVVLKTKLNSFVVVVHNGFVYVAGAADALIVLARDSKRLDLTSFSHNCMCRSGLRMLDEAPRLSDPILHYFRQEPLQATDAYLVMASLNINNYIREKGFLLPILQSRIDAEGLKEACMSMVGPYRDGNKILIVITLQPGAHLRKNSFQPVAKEMLDTTIYNIHKEEMVNDPLSFLLPYVNGKKQHPVPLTTVVYTDYGSIPQRCSRDGIEIVCSSDTETK